MTDGKVKIRTPIGTLSFSAGAKETMLVCPITICHIEPVLPQGMSVEACRVVLLRCTPYSPLKEFVFSCKWEDVYANSYSNSGEGLDAWAWESNDVLVMIGTEDSELLNSRLGLKTDCTVENYPVTMTDNGIDIKLEEVAEKNEFSLHFVIAWNTLPEPVELSCWFAVDVPHKKILQICK